jgi:phytoene desaturase
VEQPSLVIIGAGLAGLSAGYFARLNGYQTHIFEHHSRAGGVAASWERHGYRIDGGIHFLMGCRPGQAIYELYRELGAIQSPADIIPLDTYGRAMDEHRGHSVTATRDLAQFVADMAAISPADRPALQKLMEAAGSLRGLDMAAMGMDKPPELTSGTDRVKQLWGARRAGRYFTGRWAHSVSEFAKDFKDPWVRWVVEHLFMPEVPVWFVAAIFGLLVDGQLGLLRGGSRAFVDGIEQCYRDLGGAISFRSTVEEILVDHGRAVGIRLADGTVHRADAVISAADGRSTIFTLLRGRFLDRRTAGRYEHWRTFPPLVMVSLGVAREFTGEPAFSMIRLQSPLEVGGRMVQGMMVRCFNYAPGFAPVGKTLLQVEFESDWDHWNLLRSDPPAYRAEKERVAAEVVDRLERHYPGIGAQVEMTDVATPYTTWRYTLNYQGAYEGFLPTPETITTAVDRTLPGLDGFFMAGQWVMPGGGVPPALFSGRHAVELLCRWDGRSFVRSSRERVE